MVGHHIYWFFENPKIRWKSTGFWPFGDKNFRQKCTWTSGSKILKKRWKTTEKSDFSKIQKTGGKPPFSGTFFWHKSMFFLVEFHHKLIFSWKLVEIHHFCRFLLIISDKTFFGGFPPKPFIFLEMWWKPTISVGFSKNPKKWWKTTEKLDLSEKP